MLPVKGSRIWMKVVCLSPAEPLMNTASFHPHSTSAIKPLCQERVHIIPRSLGWIKWGSEEQLTHKGQGGPARRKPVLLKAPEPLRGILLLQPPSKSWWTPETSFLECWPAYWLNSQVLASSGVSYSCGRWRSGADTTSMWTWENFHAVHISNGRYAFYNFFRKLWSQLRHHFLWVAFSIPLPSMD